MRIVTTKKLQQVEVISLLRYFDDSSDIPLSKGLDFESYGKKLSDFAYFVIAYEEKTMIAFIAYYLNEEGKFAYIPQVVVHKNHRHRGIGHRMINTLCTNIDKRFTSIRLEVLKENRNARLFYKREGFVEIEDRNERILLAKENIHNCSADSLLSIIVPVYNVENYLPTCIESLINQSYSNKEIILVDDGSTDSSGIICDKYADRYTFISVVHQKNEGLSCARNTGFAKSRGQYIAFLDSDDWATPTMYEDLISLMELHHCKIGCANYIWHEQDGKSRLCQDKMDGTMILSQEEAIKSVLTYGVIGNSVNSKLYARDILEDVIFIKGLLFEDIVHTASVLLKVQSIVYTSQPLWNYRVRNGSISHGNPLNLFDAIKARDIRYTLLYQAFPMLKECLDHEYKQAFFYIISTVATHNGYLRPSLLQIKHFKKWTKEQNINIRFLEWIKILKCLV